ncbi:MAG: zinc ribbon domain-containing protein [Anaerolineae bacterium]
MGSLFDRLRSGAGKAAFEADKLRRIAAVQSNVRSLKEEITQAFYRAGYIAFDTYQADQIDQPDLVAACERIANLQAQLAAYEREIEAIRDEAYEEPTHVPQTGLVCPDGHGELPPGAQFCPVCGARGAQAPAAEASCPACGAALMPEARFCPKCGAPVQSAAKPEPVEEQPPTVSEPAIEAPLEASLECPTCGRTLAPNARFCPDCGTAASQPRADELREPEPAPIEESAPVTSESPESAPEPQATETVNRCPACGAPLVPEAAFCPDCGHRLEPSGDSATGEPPSGASEESTTPEPPTSETDEPPGWTL